MSAAGSGAEIQSEIVETIKLTVLCELPSQLADASEHEVLEITIRHLIEVYPGLSFVRIQLVDQNQQPSDVLEWSQDERIPSAMASVQGTELSQQAAMRRGVSLYTQLLQSGTESYADWQLLQQQFGMQSFAAAPLMVSGTVHGAMLAASPHPRCFNAGSIHLLEMAASMLAPYAAVLFKYEQIKTTRRLMAQVLPERVIDAAVQRLQLGGLSAADLFVPTHHDASHEQQQGNH